MAFFWGRFDPILTEVDPEVKDLYRIRDNDEQYNNNEALKVDKTSLGARNMDNYIVNQNKHFYVKPSDPIWLKMTESERIENGLPTRKKIIQSSMFGMGIAMVSMGFAMAMFSKIYYPGGIILRNQRKEGVFGYLQKRLPFTTLFFLTLYIVRGHLLNYNIDFFSEEEDQIDKQLESIAKQ